MNEYNFKTFIDLIIHQRNDLFHIFRMRTYDGIHSKTVALYILSYDSFIFVFLLYKLVNNQIALFFIISDKILCDLHLSIDIIMYKIEATEL